ncbi:hypothetical protein [Puniceibacterium confluentis]|uniref:hypothetical protein n=1 Tax=Puniceibacterium confluentis TaxID=1958944 RepID=UPI0011B3652D|nr:hypothetical protein [Puniceibacterium confluentis]
MDVDLDVQEGPNVAGLMFMAILLGAVVLAVSLLMGASFLKAFALYNFGSFLCLCFTTVYCAMSGRRPRADDASAVGHEDLPFYPVGSTRPQSRLAKS